jgi:alkylation response protein AidB-like acyl-CoA dehydrogenase
MLTSETYLDPLFDLARTRGAAAGLSAVLDGVDVAAVAPHRWTAVPAGQALPSAPTLPNLLATAEGITIVQHPGGGDGPGLTGLRSARLGAVRLGLVTAMLDLAVPHLRDRTAGGVPLLDKQLITGTIADLLTEITVLRLSFAAVGDDTPAGVTHDVHAQIGELGWQVTMLYGARGYLADHPVRCLHVSDLIANLWLPGGAR